MTAEDPRRGTILLTVLWAIALMATLAMAAAVTFRGFVGVAGVGRDRVQADALLTAGLEMAAGTVLGLGDDPLTERELAVGLSTGTVRARFSDEGGRIDIGKAPAPVLAALLRFAGAPDLQAQGVAQQIEIWRQNARNPAARPPDQPNDPAEKHETGQPFADVREVLQVPGMAPEWLPAMIPLTTVFGSDTVNPLTAPADVLAALPGVNQAQLQGFLALRLSSPTDADRLTAALGAASAYLAVKPQRVVAIELAAALRDGYAAAARAIVVLLPQDSQPYRVLVWKPLPSFMVR
jgi:general secretion pathway protein K